MRFLTICLVLASPISALAQAPATTPVPVKLTNPKAIADASKYRDIIYKYSPETASADGQAKYDGKISDLSIGGERGRVRDLTSGLKKLSQAADKESDPAAKQELTDYIASQQAILAHDDDALGHQVTFIDAATFVSNGLAPILDPAMPMSRRISAGERLKRYVGMDPDPAGNSRLTEGPSYSRSTAPMTGVAQDIGSVNPTLVATLIKRMKTEMENPSATYPSRTVVALALEHDNEVINGLLASLRASKITNWEQAFALLQRSLIAYNSWVRENILPKTK